MLDRPVLPPQRYPYPGGSLPEGGKLMSTGETNTRVQALVTAHAVLSTVEHILQVSTSLEDARLQVRHLVELVKARATEEQVPSAMLREGGREVLMDLL